MANKASQRARGRSRKRLRRETRKRSARRQNSDGALARLPLEACYVNEGWRESGMATVVVARRHPGDTITFCAFLVDVWGLGLKDAWGQRRVPAADFDGWLEGIGLTTSIVMTPCPLELARRLVWGGVFFAAENGFRVPASFARWKRVVGPWDGPPEVPTDLFGKNGKVLLVGDLDDLQAHSLEPLDLEDDSRHFIVGIDPHSDDDDTLSGAFTRWLDRIVAAIDEDDASGDIPADKERIMLCELEARLLDAKRAREVLLCQPDFSCEDDSDGESTLIWTREYPPGHWNPTAQIPGARQRLATLHLDADGLLAVTQTRGWMLSLCTKLHDLLCDTIRFEWVTETDPLSTRARDEARLHAEG